MASRDSIIVLEADPNDPEDRPVNLAGLKRARMAQDIRLLRHRVSMSQTEFAAAYRIPLASLRQYEIARYMPPPAVRAYLKVIAAIPDRAAEVLR